jgi:hypothetical protein
MTTCSHPQLEPAKRQKTAAGPSGTRAEEALPRRSEADIVQEMKSHFNDFIKLEGSLRLDETNWAVWRAQMIRKFNRCGVVGYVNGTSRCPDNLADREAVGSWTRNDNLARVLISWNVTLPEQVKIMECRSAHEMWKSLEIYHGSQGPMGSKTTPAAQWRKLFSITAEEGDNIIKHLDKLKQCRDQITFDALGGKRFEISDSLFSTIIATSLPSSWDSFTESLMGDVDNIWMANPQRFIDLIGQVYRDRGQPNREGNTILRT